jgi:hypothetical protein
MVGRLTNNKFYRIWKEAIVVYSRYYPGICFQGLRNTTRNVSQDSRCPGLGVIPLGKSRYHGNFYVRVQLLPVLRHVTGHCREVDCHISGVSCRAPDAVLTISYANSTLRETEEPWDYRDANYLESQSECGDYILVHSAPGFRITVTRNG